LEWLDEVRVDSKGVALVRSLTFLLATTADMILISASSKNFCAVA